MLLRESGSKHDRHSNTDGSTDVYLGPSALDGKEDYWIQIMPGKGWFTILRLYSSLEAFLDKSWKVGEIDLIV